ncbi:MAG: type II toxin-antitoxin system RelE/ParE family toxin [Anaeroplasmataceae bacterium]
MDYSILRTDKFNDQLIDIIMYINDAFSKKDAYEFLDYIEEQIDKLKMYPLMGVVPRYQAIARQGYRALICRKNIIFYKINEIKKEIVLYIIVSSKRNYLNLI